MRAPSVEASNWFIPPFKPNTLMGSKLYMTPKSTDIISNRVIDKAFPKIKPAPIAHIAFAIYNHESSKTASLFKPNKTGFYRFCL